jgi:protein TonB
LKDGGIVVGTDMLAGSDDNTKPWRDTPQLDRSWKSMAWSLVLSLALHLGVAGPLIYMLSQAAQTPSGAALSVELSKVERLASAGDHEPESEKPEHPPAEPVVTTARPRLRQRSKRVPVSDAKPSPTITPKETAVVEAPLASPQVPATRPAMQASSAPSSVTSAPRVPAFHLVYAPQPAYPRLAQQLGLEGRVVLGIWVSANGVPDTIVVKESSGYDSLDESAKEGVRKWRFEIRDSVGALAGGWVTQPITFRLE